MSLSLAAEKAILTISVASSLDRDVTATCDHPPANRSARASDQSKRRRRRRSAPEGRERGGGGREERKADQTWSPSAHTGATHLWGQLQNAGSLELVVQNGLNEVLAGALARVSHPLVRADGVVSVNAPSALIVQTRAKVEGVVGEEALVVEGVSEHLGHRGAAHGLFVKVLVILRPQGQNLVQLRPISVESRACDEALLVHFQDHGLVRGQDAEPGREPAMATRAREERG